MSVTACHNCVYNGKGNNHCLNCRRIDQDDIRIKKSPHLPDTSDEWIGKEQAAQFVLPPANNLNLDEKTERVKMLLYTVSSLTPLEFVAALHLARGGRGIDLAAELLSLVKYCAGSRTLKRGRHGRALISMKRTAMLKRCAKLSAVLGSRGSEADE